MKTKRKTKTKKQIQWNENKEKQIDWVCLSTNKNYSNLLKLRNFRDLKAITFLFLTIIAKAIIPCRETSYISIHLGLCLLTNCF